MTDLSSRIAQLSPEKRALLARRLEQSRATSPPPGREPLAVVGIACRFPGGADTPDAFWQLLVDGVDAITVVPPDRWDAQKVFDPDPQAPGKTTMRWGGFLESVDGFDADFFGISPREADRMDPQQRLLLETAWEAIEAGGRSVDALRGQGVGVFVGAHSMSADYYVRQLANPRTIDIYTSTGAAHSILANRLSYLLDLRGPSLVVDTACSSSLVAVHLAAQSLRNRECDFAIAAGINLMLTPETTIAFSKLQIAAADGRCKTFDASADGAVRGEGCGVLVVRRLADAVKDGDPILAVIRGTAMNQDGATNGLTAPSGLAQEAVVRSALADAGIPGSAVTYVETHGTGTALGDPIEVQALATTIGAGTDVTCYLGAVKSNIGHLESAAGVAGLIKAILCLQRRSIPRNLHFRSLNPHISFEGTRFALPAETTPWSSAAGVARVCAVSSFGFGGTNAHVILEEAPAVASAPAAERPSGPVLVPVSARSEAAVRAVAAQWASMVREAGSDAVAEELASTAALRRTHHGVRRTVVAPSREELALALDRVAAGERLTEVTEHTDGDTCSGVVFVYSGQGGHWPAMGLDLADREPVFREALTRCDQAIQKHASWSLFAELRAPESRLHRTAIGQPALFSIQYALTELLGAWGIHPDAVVGHSAGEVVAAHVAGVLGFEEAVHLSVLRGRLMDPASGGRMLAVELTAAEAVRTIAPFGGRVGIAAMNSPTSCVVSGPAADIAALAATLAERSVFAKALAVEYAFHSRDMENPGEELARALTGLRRGAQTIPIVSTVTGREATDEDFTAGYWKRNVVDPVRFGDAIQALAGQGHEIFVEIGAHPALTASIRRCGAAAGKKLFAIPTLRRGEEGLTRVLQTVGALYELGVMPDWRRIAPAHAAYSPLPAYPWQRRRHWVDAPEPSAERAGLPDWFYEQKWVLKPGASAPPPDAEWIPESRQLARRIMAAPSLASTDATAGVIDQVEAISTALIVAALRQLGCPLREGDRLDAEGLADSLCVEARHRRLFERLLDTLTADGILRRDGRQLVVRSTPPATDARGAIARLAAASPESTPVLRLLNQCGTRLGDVLVGRADAVSLLFGDDQAGAAQAYANASFARVANGAMADALGAVVEALPADRSIRVLEIGAGTGSTTAALLPLLPADRTEYVFTDVSTVFLQRARETLGAYPFVRYELLDIERDPLAQTFAPHQYDIIVAANVLHATADLRQTLAHARQLLAPSGLLLILEGARPHRWIDLTFGLTDGWWRFADPETRGDYPLVSAETWTALFEETGLRTEAVPLPADLFDQTIVIGRSAAGAPLGYTLRPDEWSVAGETWCIFADRGGVAAAVSQLLSDSRATSIVVEPGDATENLTGVAEALRRAGAPLGAILDLRPLDASEGGAPPEMGEREDVCSGALDVCKLLTQAELSPSRGMWIVTRNVHPLGGPSDARLSLAQSTVWGLGRVISLEHPHLWGALIDIGTGTVDAAARAVFDEIRGTDGEDQVALRSGARFVPRLVRVRGLEVQRPVFRRDRSYLITGGLGRLGLKIAAWMAANGARWLVLASRTGLPGRNKWDAAAPHSPERQRIDAVRELERSGAVVITESADASDHERMSHLFARFGGELPPLAGVIHAAGTLQVQPVETIDRAQLDAVLEPKVAGARNLDALTRRLTLDFFVMFSSGASLWGAKGHAHYAAANHFLDTLAHERRRAGLPALSINWGWWEGGGTTEQHHEHFRQIGLGTLPVEDALTALGSLLVGDRTQVAVAEIRWDTFKPVFEARRHRPFLACVGPAVAESSRRTSTPEPAARPETWERLLEHVRGQVASVLGIAEKGQIEARTGFFQIGMDSITTVELRKRLETTLGCELPATIAFEYPNTEALSRYLAERIGIRVPGAVPRDRTAPAVSLEAEVGPEPQSEDELAALLDQAVAHALGSRAPGKQH